MKLYVLVREYYGDFDIIQTKPLYVSSSKDSLKIKRKELLSTRSQEEIDNEVDFSIAPYSVKLI